jgi:tetratricopeptide (TPR) repeat protein
MGRLSAKVYLILLLVVCSSLALDSYAWGQEQAPAPRMEGRITAKGAEVLEEELNTNPDNLAARQKLISYYFREMLTSQKPELEERREQHVFWLIEHHPESELAGSPEAGIMPIGFSGSTEGYQRGKQLWLQNVEKHPDDQRILSNAAQFLSVFDAKIGRGLLEKASALDPDNTETSSRLAQSYEQERALARSPEEKVTLSQKAVTVRERGLEKADDEHRFYELGALATSAFEAGETATAQKYASELLISAPKFKNDWNYGNALYEGNVVLGRLALERGDIAGAKEHLLAAGQTPGSPQLDSFGPNMTLAKELLEKGEREVVLTYLQSCVSFWKMGGDKLQAWIATIRGGGTPDFGTNLHY